MLVYLDFVYHRQQYCMVFAWRFRKWTDWWLANFEWLTCQSRAYEKVPVENFLKRKNVITSFIDQTRHYTHCCIVVIEWYNLFLLLLYECYPIVLNQGIVSLSTALVNCFLTNHTCQNLLEDQRVWRHL